MSEELSINQIAVKLFGKYFREELTLEEIRKVEMEYYEQYEKGK